MERISATLGIDMSTATPEKAMKRGLEYCLEMAECYEDDTLERDAFEALAVVFQMIQGGE